MRTFVGLAVSVVVAAAGLFAFSPRLSEPLDERYIPVENMNITSLGKTSAGLVAAGELGQILISRDDGATWSQASLSHQRHALITGMYFVDSQLGFANGHEGWILRTTDGGASWTEVAFDDERNEPMLSVRKLPSGEMLAVGGFGKALNSNNKGQDWQLQEPPGGLDWHLNALIPASDQQTWLMVGEAGTVFRSDDAGQSWTQLPEFYNGSFYGGLHLGGTEWLVYGMRGNIFRSRDNARSWEKVELNMPVSLFTHERLSDTELLLAGQGAVILYSSDNGQSFQPVYGGQRISLTDIELVEDEKILISSDKGLRTLPLSLLRPDRLSALSEPSPSDKS